MNCKESGARVRSCRKYAGLTMSDLAGRSGTTYQYVSRIEKGEATGVSVQMMERIAKELDVDTAFLLCYQEVPVKQEGDRLLELYKELSADRQEDIVNIILMYLLNDNENYIDELLKDEQRIDALFNGGIASEELRRFFLSDLLV